MKYQLIIFLLLAFTSTMQSQSDAFPKHSIVLDAGGIGGYGSLNYERPFWAKQDFLLSVRAIYQFFFIFPSFAKKWYQSRITPSHH